MLSLKAYNLLIEEYPLAVDYIKVEKGSCLLKVPVTDYNGIGRFVTGLREEIEIISPESFKKYLKAKIKGFWDE